MPNDEPLAPLGRLTWRRVVALVALGNGATIALLVTFFVHGFGDAMDRGGSSVLGPVVLLVSPGVCVALALASSIMAFIAEKDASRAWHAANAKGARLALVAACGAMAAWMVWFVQSLE